ncbi:MAG: radical SAM protein [Patescibacteria group bacterium]
MPIKVGLVQINTSFSGLDYLPYSVGILEAYARRHLSNPTAYKFLLPIFTRIPVRQAVADLHLADFVAFSVYAWNEQISLAIARELKRERPGIIIVFGGPQMLNRPDEIEAYLRKHNFIDLACHGEGEKVFLAVLENAHTRTWEQVPSVSYFDVDGLFVQYPRIPRIRDLSDVPSPYLDGIFEPLIAAYPDRRWIPTWETNRGCPFACTFCGWGSAVNTKVTQWELGRLLCEVDWFTDHDVEYISCADANFGILPRDVEIAEYVAKVKRERGCFPAGFSVQNTKNATERAYTIQKIISDAGLNRGVVLSMQSLDPVTLANIRRDNISLKTYEVLQGRFRKDGVETMSDLILGLPGETYDSFADGVSTLMDRGQHNRIQFNNLSVLPDAEMWDPAYRRQFGMQTVRSKIINIHGFRSEFDEVPEFQELVIATDSMPHADWARARAFAWMCGLLHFDKVFQIPLIIAHEVAGISYRELIELFSDGVSFLSPFEFPRLQWTKTFFRKKAEEIQRGGEEYHHSKKWLDIWWPLDEYCLIELCTSGRFGEFYTEALEALRRFFAWRAIDMSEGILEDAARLNQSLIKLPFQTEDLLVEPQWNIWDFYQGVTRGESVKLTQGRYSHRVDRTRERWNSWEEWCKLVVWYGNKRGAYLYGNTPQEQLAGHY